MGEDGEDSGESEGEDGTPGRGGVNRGRADAPLRLGKTSPELQNELKPEYLPKGKMTNPEAAELYGLSAAAPEANPASTPGGALRADETPQSGIVIRRQWTAGQRRTIQEYFQEDP